jgi:hypothetical protein
MHFFYAHPWFMFLAGVWFGVFAGCTLALGLAGSRAQRFEEKRALLQLVLDRNKFATRFNRDIRRQGVA